MASLGLRSLLVDPKLRAHASAGPATFGGLLASRAAAAANESDALAAKMDDLVRETLAGYRAAMTDFVVRLQALDSRRFGATMCCRHLVVARSAPRQHKAVVTVTCREPMERAQAERPQHDVGQGLPGDSRSPECAAWRRDGAPGMPQA
eukprot:351159-Chlamydomonas_euryale.AAC.10